MKNKEVYSSRGEIVYNDRYAMVYYKPAHTKGMILVKCIWGDNFYEIMDKVEDWLNEEYTGVNICFYEDLDGQINDSII